MSNSADGKRLNKYISETGFCSRREADRLIEQQRVTINGKVPEMGTKVMPGDNVEIDGKPVRSKEKPIYIALNKPTGITCTTERDVPGNIVDFVGHHKRIFPIGRLDKPSDGLIFLTNDAISSIRYCALVITTRKSTWFVSISQSPRTSSRKWALVSLSWIR
ncbi:ribosomal large subunit pseudouridine synthase F [Vibrio variabilis]|uniref:Dual-specificity RNA pseudouridine synthase RluF n=1 Tax=Vibrio variabilis TaxID=990271 RepID=A0ABQ0JQL3_9VIBR|nr:ribosomal large subunit pseudouridine synthase F [Vibrio variabilis]